MVEESTKAHLLSDVPVATFLSGGLDSSYLTALAARHQPGISAYTIGFRAEDAKFEAMPDDLKYARVVAEKFGVDLHEIEIAPQVLELLPKMTYHLDEPIGDPAAINTYLICTAAREAGVKVMLSGMGADELFAGYRKHLANKLALRYQRMPGAGAPTRAVRCGQTAGGDGASAATARCGSRSGSCRSRTCRRRPRSGAATRCTTATSWLGLLNPDLAGTVDDVLTEHADTYHDNALSDFVNRMCLADARLFLPGPEPRVHRPVEHGRVHRGAGAVRGRRGREGRVRDPRHGRRSCGRQAEDGAQEGRRARSCRARSCTGPRGCSPRRCGRG